MTKFLAIYACIFVSLDLLSTAVTTDETILAWVCGTGCVCWLFIAALVFIELEER